MTFYTKNLIFILIFPLLFSCKRGTTSGNKKNGDIPSSNRLLLTDDNIKVRKVLAGLITVNNAAELREKIKKLKNIEDIRFKKAFTNILKSKSPGSLAVKLGLDFTDSDNSGAKIFGGDKGIPAYLKSKKLISLKNKLVFGFIQFLARYFPISITYKTVFNDLDKRVSKINEEDFNKFIKEYRDLSKYDVEKFTSIDAKAAIGLDKVTGNGLKSVEMITDIMLNDYFKEISEDKKLKIIGSILGSDVGKIEPRHVIVGAISHSGPVVQKMFQFMADEIRESMSEEDLKKIENKELVKELDRLKSDLPRISDVEMKERIIEALQDPNPDVDNSGKKITYQEAAKVYYDRFGSQNPKTIATASVGQAAILTDKTTGKEIIVKLQKPGVQKNFVHEKEILMAALSKHPDRETADEALNLLDKAFSSIEDELDFRKEVDALEKAALAYNEKYLNSTDSKGAITVVRPVGIDREVGGVIQREVKFKNVLFMEKADGKELKKFSDINLKDLEIRKKAVSEFFTLWLRGALMGNGFFHSDLHGGNMFLNISDDKKSWKMTAIDLGANATLSKSQQEAAIVFGLGRKKRDPIKMVLGLRGLVDNPSAFDSIELRQKLINEFSEVIDNTLKKGLEKASENKALMRGITDVLERNKVSASEQFIQFFRGSAFVELEIAKINRQIDSYNRVNGTQMQKIDIEQIHSKVSGNAVQDIWKSNSTYWEKAKKLFGLGSDLLTVKKNRYKEVLKMIRWERNTYGHERERIDFKKRYQAFKKIKVNL